MLKKLLIPLFLLMGAIQAFSQPYFDIYNVNANEFPKTKAYVVAKQPMGIDYTNLTINDFVVIDNGVDVTAKAVVKCEETNEYPPMSAVLVLDVSESMLEITYTGETKMQWVKIAATAFIDSVRWSPGTAVSIISFAGQIDRNIGWKTNVTDLRTEMGFVRTAYGATDFNRPFLDPKAAMERLQERDPNIRRVIVFLSDGNHLKENPFRKSEVIKKAKEIHAQIFCISVASNYNSDMFEMADSTGGKYFTVNKKDQLLEVYRKISEEVQSKKSCWLEWNNDYICDGTSLDRKVNVTFKRTEPSVSVEKPYKFPAAAVAKIDVTPGTLYFGRKGDGNLKHDITIKGVSGITTVTGYDITPVPADFTIDWKGNVTPFTVKAGDSKVISLTFVKDPAVDPAEYSFKLKTTPCEAPAVALIAPCGGEKVATYDFSDVPTGVATAKTITCAYKNTAPRPISGNVTLEGTDKAMFQITKGAGAFTLQPGTCLDIDVQITPTTTGPKTAEIRYNIPDDCGEPVTQLTAKAAAVDFPLSSLQFGLVRQGVTSTKTYTIQNKTTSPAKITSIDLKTKPDNQYTLTNTNSLPVTLAPNQSIDVTIAFAPKAEGNFTNDIVLKIENLSKDPSASITGTGFLPKIQAAPLTFPDTKLNVTSAPVDLVIKNTSAFGPLTITKFDLAAGDFAFVSAPPAKVVVPANGQVAYPLTFTPKAAGARTASIILTNDAAPGKDSIITTNVILSGNGVDLDITPKTGDYGTVVTCDEPVKTYTINNTGSSALTGTVTVTGSNPAAFVVNNPAINIAAKSSGSFTVRFNPDLATTYSANLNVNTSAGNTVIALSGKGTSVNQKTEFADSYLKIEAGKSKEFEFSAELPSLGSKKYNNISYVINYNPSLVKFDASHFTGANGWTWTIDNSKELQGIVKLNGTNAGGVAGGSSLSNTVGFTTFITNSATAAMTIKSEFDAAYDCIIALTDTVVVESETCFNEGALIDISDQQYMIKAVNPNPVNDKVKFEYELAFDSHVSLVIYDSFGQKVAVVLDGAQKKGAYEKQVSLSELANGLYFYVFEAGPHRESNKMIISK